MLGAIRKRNILAHPILTVRCFGWRVFVRAVFAPKETTLPEALELVLALECSEINYIFRGVVVSSDSPFIRRLRAFNCAGRDHLAYIARCLTQLDPSLGEACRPLMEAREDLQEAGVAG